LKSTKKRITNKGYVLKKEMGSPGGKEDKEGKNSTKESSTLSTFDSPIIIIFLLPKKHLVSFMDIFLLL